MVVERVHVTVDLCCSKFETEQLEIRTILAQPLRAGNVTSGVIRLLSSVAVTGAPLDPLPPSC